MKIVLKILLAVVLVVLVAAGGFYAWASHKDGVLLSRAIPTHHVDFPIPFPLTDDEAATIRQEREAAKQPAPTDAELAAIALDRARERGKHLVQSRYACVGCHGSNFGGGTMVNSFAIGALLGPNITTGTGSRTLTFTASDWDRAVRHGVKHDGLVSMMPAEDFKDVSDQELSDVVSYIRSMPPVDATVPLPKLGPLGTVLVAVGQIRLAVDVIPDHNKPHAKYPPEAAVNVEFGKHLAAICSGCHHADFAGGKIPGGDPSWPPSMNLTPHADGLAGWTYDQFTTVIKTGTKLDGTPIKEPMTLMLPVIQAMTDTERQALFKFLQSLPPVPSPKS